ncbi:hypothetical protein LU290_07750 [Moraxella nasibovis]|uniref:hypothetical protein n=1 Tax=Moraxella nasibovis TaxID=2904120 RepID=UPI0024108BCD|nr:hypothetical protein [Moraxella nasibovis]WFF38147.1 hypothetical protein LU290_07750 [Moraxella nasibovis]
MLNKTLIASIAVLTIISFPTVAQAKTYKDTAKCGVIAKKTHPNPASLPQWVTGSGTGKTQAKACAAAKKDATSKIPRDAQAKHCDCGKKI